MCLKSILESFHVQACFGEIAIQIIRMKKLVVVQQIRSQSEIQKVCRSTPHRREQTGRLYFKIKSSPEAPIYYKITPCQIYCQHLQILSHCLGKNTHSQSFIHSSKFLDGRSSLLQRLVLELHYFLLYLLMQFIQFISLSCFNMSEQFTCYIQGFSNVLMNL